MKGTPSSTASFHASDLQGGSWKIRPSKNLQAAKPTSAKVDGATAGLSGAALDEEALASCCSK